MNTNQFQLEVILAEHKTLRDEILEKTRLHVEIYVAFVAALGIFYGIIVSSCHYDLIYFLPLLALSLLCRIIWDQKIITVISQYLYEIEETIKRLYSSISVKSNESCQIPQNIWIGWQHYYYQHAPRRYYEWSIVLLFIIISMMPSLLYSILCIHPTLSSFIIDTKIPQIVHLVILLLNISVTLCACYLIHQNVFKRRKKWKKSSDF